MGMGHHVLLTVAATLVLTPPAVAQTTLDTTVKVTPSAGGSPRHPQGHKIAGTVEVLTPGGAVRPIVTGLEVWYGRGLEFRRDRVPTCSSEMLAKGGPDACPPASRVGVGTGPAIEPPEGATSPPKLQFFNAPGGKMIAYATLQLPARVRAVLDDDVVAGARGLWPYRDAWPFPPNMQVVAGIPITLDSLAFAFGYTKAAKNYISSTSCPKGGWAWRVRVHTRVPETRATAVLQANGRAPCTRTR